MFSEYFNYFPPLLVLSINLTKLSGVYSQDKTFCYWSKKNKFNSR